MELNHFWAKTNPFQSIVTHGIVSGTVCRYLMSEYGKAMEKVNLRGKALGQAAQQKKWLSVEIRKIKEEAEV